MKLDAKAVHYLLTQHFADVPYHVYANDPQVDYPLIYDEGEDVSGHVVLIPDHKRPIGGSAMENVLCVCTSKEVAETAQSIDLPVAYVRDRVTFPHVYNVLQEIFARSMRMDAQLNAYLNTYAGFQPLLDAVAQTMNFPCTLLDERFCLIGHAQGGQAAAGIDASALQGEAMMDQEVIDLLTGSRDYSHMRTSHRIYAVPGSHNLLVKNIFSGTSIVGMLVIQHSGDPDSVRFVRFLLNYLAPFVEKMYDNFGEFPRKDESAHIHATIIRAIKKKDVDLAYIDRLLVEDGHDPGSTYALMLLDRSFSQESPQGLHYFAQRINCSWTNSYAVVVDDELFVCAYMGTLRAEQMHSLRSDLPELLRDIMAKAGVSRLFQSATYLHAACTQARLALREGKRVDPSYWYYRFEDYALIHVLANGIGSTPLEHVIHPAVACLAHYDEANQTQLLHTLRMFMKCRYNASAAAKCLFVARSTLLNRLERIAELTGIDLDDFEERTYLAMSLHVEQIGSVLATKQ